MRALAYAAAAFVALEHVGIFVLEAFLWTKPIGRRIFGLSEELARASAPLAANQGLYNLFLAAGIVWGLSLGPAGSAIRIFFLFCVLVAGIVGAATAKRSILWTQGLPAAIALVLAYLSPP
jgi:putative membrane protein